jgi:hypothetical protein
LSVLSERAEEVAWVGSNLFPKNGILMLNNIYAN